jgi:hypothetical protein
LSYRVWTRFKKNTTGPFKDELTFKAAKSLEQEKGTNLCGFYVCEYIRWFTTERRAHEANLEVRKQYSQFYFITINYVEFHLTYIYHIDLLLKDEEGASEAPTKGALMSNSRGIVGIPIERGHRSKRRTL